MTEPTAQSVSLYLTEGSSDKEYHAQLKPQENGWVVNFQYGRRGKALQSGTKTATPVDFALAQKEYTKLVAEKTKKGYTPDVSGEVFQDTQAGENFSGFLPQLPQTVRSPDDIEAMILDPAFVLQEKFDGDNRQLHRSKSGEVGGINKRGIVVSLPMNLVNQTGTLPDFLASGEIIANKIYLFDLQEADGADLRDKPYSARLRALETLFADLPDIVVVETARTVAEKRAMIERIRENAGEGVVFKRVNSVFRTGKLSATESDHFKWKFTEDCTVRVTKAHATKRSVEVEIDGVDGKPQALGKVTIPPNKDVPSPGDLVSLTYLHLFEGGALFQAQYKCVRTDCEGPDTLDMFKIKPKELARKLSM
jgi:bifunctional non-homologous end joining protein LigD